MEIDKASIKHAIKLAGGPAEVARRLGRTRQAVSQWVHNGVSAECAEDLDAISGVSKSLLCPRVFGEHHRNPRKRCPEVAA